MAGADRAQARHLTFLASVAEDINRFGLFPVVRAAEARAGHLPRVGRSRKPAQNIIDLSHTPSMAFNPATLDALRIVGARARLSGFWLGLTGPMGPLPTHITEFAFYEKRYAATTPFNDWLDVLAGRMLQLFYRAWADSQPAAMADRPGDDPFADFLAALSGAREGAGPDAAFPAHARVHYAGLYAGRRSAVAIEDALCHLLGQPVRLLEYQPRWRDLEPEDRSRLGRSFATLGGDAVLGFRVRSAADAIRVVIRAADFPAYRSLLPRGDRFGVAAEALDSFTPTHIEWDICLELADDDAPPARLDGRTMLGWSSWVKRPGAKSGPGPRKIRADAHLRRLPRLQQRNDA